MRSSSSSQVSSRIVGSSPAVRARSIAERDSRRLISSPRIEFEERGVAQFVLPGQDQPFGQGLGHLAELELLEGAVQVGADRVDRACRVVVVVIVGLLGR